MRISITYLYTIFRYGYPHGVEDALRALPEIRKLGFRYLEMEGLGRAHLSGVYRLRQQFRHTLDDLGMHVHNFCVVDPDLVSLNVRRREAALGRFARGAELASYLGAETVHLASYAPPVRYLSARPYQLEGRYRFAGQTRVRIPRGFDWERVWEALVISCRRSAEIAGDRTVLMEPRVGEVICSVDSLIRLMEHVGRPNLKANFDTGHFSAQRENVALALMKLRGRFANIHISDNNPADTVHLPVGKGAIDWPEFFRVLRMLGYTGYLGLDFSAPDYRPSVRRIRALARPLGIPIEI